MDSLQPFLTTLINGAILASLFGFAGYMALKHGAKGAVQALATIRADVPNLDRVEGTITTLATPDQLKAFREIAFPMFALGLSITPQGDLKEAIARTKELTDILTDSQPNTPTDTSAAGTIKDGAAG